MEDLSEMCQIIRTRARTVIAKVSGVFVFCPHTGSFIIFKASKYNHFDFQVKEYQGSFTSYRYLWTDDRSDAVLCSFQNLNYHFHYLVNSVECSGQRK